jgi:hypothetical protein
VVAWTQPALFPLWKPGDLVRLRGEMSCCLGRVVAVHGMMVEVEWPPVDWHRQSALMDTMLPEDRLEAVTW